MPTNVDRRRDVAARRCSLDLALLCALVAIAVVPSADAALPTGGAKLVSHDHSTRGDGWHVEITISSDARRVSQLVLHDERCRATVLARNVPIGPGGVIDVAWPFTSRGRSGTWELDAAFPDAGHAQGSFQVMLPDCTGPVRQFSAHARGHAHRRHHAHLHGTKPGRYAGLSRATPARRGEARRLWRSSVRESRGRFATYARARRLGFKPMPGFPSRRPQLFHLRHGGYAGTPGSFDARRPESLVYWNPPRRGEPVLIAFMYRLPTGFRPRFAAPLLGWHRHRGGRSQMTHVWLTGDLRSALANCLPIAALEAAIPRYRFDPAGRSRSHESVPCTGPAATTAASRSVRVGDNWFVRSRGVPTVTVRRGDRVTWRFVGREPHNVQVQRGPERFASPTRDRGSYSRRMARRGTYTLICSIHGARDQRMRLVVR